VKFPFSKLSTSIFSFSILLADKKKFQVPSEAQKIDLTNEVRAKSESMWRSRLVELMEDLEASKISIHGLLQVKYR
jgi:hypothetical protein